jgi:hypothetical protein
MNSILHDQDKKPGCCLRVLNSVCLRSLFAAVLVTFLGSGTLLAQNEDFENVIYLKDGGILRGEIIEMISDSAIRIEITGGNVFVIQMNEVDKITEEEPVTDKYFKTSGYINQIGADILTSESTTTLRFQMLNGYRFNPNFSAGIGIGYIPFNDPLAMIPIYLELTYNFLRANTTPFVFMRSGYNFTLHPDDEMEIEDHRGGWMINPGIGIHFSRESGFQWYMNAGYNLNNASFDQEGFGNEILVTDIKYKRVMFGMGFSF